MKKNEEWMKKRMEDIPQPILVGTFEMTQEEKIKASEDLKKIIEESTGKKIN